MAAHNEVVIINAWVKILFERKSPRKSGDLIEVQISFPVFSHLRREKPRNEVDKAL